ncbi:MAG: adenine deaminase [Desulfobacteraceae bacterium]|nr:MAG: adenine deaminase [Desulfobacteraceae bacterium]
MKFPPQNIFKPRTDSKELMKTALGETPADAVITNGRLVNVYTGELLDSYQVSIKGDRIAFVGPDAWHTIGPDTEIFDVQGRTIIPGLIDGHAHLAWLVNIKAFLGRVMTGGTTTIITETMEPFPISGYQEVLDFLDSLKDQPIKILATAPAMISISPATKGIDPVSLKKLLERPDMVGLGESYWLGYMEYLLQKAVDYGFEPIRAVQMATLNVAEHFGLDRLIGGIAPGKYADLVVLPDLKQIKPSHVFSNGRLLAKDGELLLQPRAHSYSSLSQKSVLLPRRLTEVDFKIQAPRSSGPIKVRVIEQVTALVTKELIREMPVQNNEIRMESARDFIICEFAKPVW